MTAANQAHSWSPVEALPQTNGHGGRPGVWKELVQDFVASGEPYAKVNIDGLKIGSVVPQVLRQIRMHKLPVKVHKRGDEVYLERA